VSVITEQVLRGGERARQLLRGEPAVSSWNRSILTEISLCHACSCHEMLRAETAGQEVVNATRQLQALGGFEVVRPEELLRRAYILLDSMIRAKAVH
jgi:hypothetical protein